MEAEKAGAPKGRAERAQVRGWWRPLALLGAVITIIVVGRLFGLDKKLLALREWIESLGAWGPVVFIFIYVGATIAALPGSVMTAIAGGIFGSVKGVIIVSIASTLGASSSFLIGRYFARDVVARWLQTKEKFRTLEQMTQEHGAVIVAFTRLLPIFPYNLLNYGLALTAVPFWTYVFWSWLCMLPATVLYVVGADAVTKAITKGEVPWVLVGVVAAAVVLIAVIARYARRKLHTGEEEGEMSDDQSPKSGDKPSTGDRTSGSASA